MADQETQQEEKPKSKEEMSQKLFHEIITKLKTFISSFDSKLKSFQERIDKINAKPQIDKQSFDLLKEKVSKMEAGISQFSQIYELISSQNNPLLIKSIEKAKELLAAQSASTIFKDEGKNDSKKVKEIKKMIDVDSLIEHSQEVVKKMPEAAAPAKAAVSKKDQIQAADVVKEKIIEKKQDSNYPIVLSKKKTSDSKKEVARYRSSVPSRNKTASKQVSVAKKRSSTVAKMKRSSAKVATLKKQSKSLTVKKRK